MNPTFKIKEDQTIPTVTKPDQKGDLEAKKIKIASARNIWGTPALQEHSFLCLGYFKQKKNFNFFLTKSRSLFAISVG